MDAFMLVGLIFILVLLVGAMVFSRKVAVDQMRHDAEHQARMDELEIERRKRNTRTRR